MITLIGVGPGDPDSLTVEARDAIEQADLLIGAARLLDAILDGGAPAVAAYKTEEILSVLEEVRPELACILYSGDSGFWSGAQGLTRRLEEKGMEYKILPGISSVQYFAARLGRPWKDWTLASAHGQDGEVLTRLREGRPVFLLTGGGKDPAKLCQTLVDAGLGDWKVTVGEDLSYPNETITAGTAAELTSRTFAPLNVVLIDPPEKMGKYAPGIPDSAFIRGQTPMTKQEVRAVILAKLAVGSDDLCWDIGAGTGSVSVELAMQGKAVWAVEYDGEALALVRQNQERFRAWNLHVVEGKAPEALESLPEPDKVFVGGSEGQLRPILRAVMERAPDARVCVSAVTLETVQEAMDEMASLGLDPEVIQMAVSRAGKAGEKHLLLAQNPVFLITGGKA